MPGSVPLRYRLPNPPPLYAGREEDEAWLRQGLASRALSALVGEAGIGKSALVARALREHAPVLHVDVPRHEPPEDLRVIA
ncbi:MAG TPA: hypothetical protein RMG95_08445, partial [Polyangiaceae bacterium LLY-WYZ-15_(1-7)]|nr:hypothetical protein [Polyangiaceae bacterium LLY-WYZ-15_(1-7)]